MISKLLTLSPAVPLQVIIFIVSVTSFPIVFLPGGLLLCHNKLTKEH